MRRVKGKWLPMYWALIYGFAIFLGSIAMTAIYARVGVPCLCRIYYEMIQQVIIIRAWDAGEKKCFYFLLSKIQPIRGLKYAS